MPVRMEGMVARICVGIQWELNPEFRSYRSSRREFENRPLGPTNSSSVRSGDMGNRTFRSIGYTFGPKGVLQGLQGFFLQINIAEIVSTFCMCCTC